MFTVTRGHSMEPLCHAVSSPQSVCNNTDCCLLHALTQTSVSVFGSKARRVISDGRDEGKKQVKKQHICDFLTKTKHLLFMDVFLKTKLIWAGIFISGENRSLNFQVSCSFSKKKIETEEHSTQSTFRDVVKVESVEFMPG